MNQSARGGSHARHISVSNFLEGLLGGQRLSGIRVRKPIPQGVHAADANRRVSTLQRTAKIFGQGGRGIVSPAGLRASRSVPSPADIHFCGIWPTPLAMTFSYT